MGSYQKRLFRAAWVGLLWAALAGGGGVTCAAPPRIVALRVGADGVVKVGHWTRVLVEIHCDDQPAEVTLEIRAPDSEGLSAVWQQQTTQGTQELIRLAPGQTAVIERFIRVGRPRGILQASLLAGGRPVSEHAVELATHCRMLASTQDWVVIIGGDVPLEKMIERHRRSAEPAPAISRWLDPSLLPRTARAYDGISMVWLVTGDEGFLHGCSPDQWAALEEWVSTGGRLVLSLGRHATGWGAEDGPLRRLLPCAVSSLAQIDVAPGLESFAHADRPLSGPFVAAVPAAPLPNVLAWFDRQNQGKQPAMGRYALGMGQVAWAMFDLDVAPFRDWPATLTLLAALWQPELQEQRSARDEVSHRVVHFGFDDMVGQLRSALDYFPHTDSGGSVAVVSFSAVAMLLVLYVLWLGPGDYFLLRLLKFPGEWTWVTLPLGILLFCGAAYGLNRYWKKSSTLRLNQVDVVDVDYSTGWVRGTTWGCAYSPHLRSYNLYLLAQPALAPVQGNKWTGALTWQGLPGNGLGGLDSTGVEAVAGQPYTIRTHRDDQSARMVAVPILAASTRSLLGEWRNRLALEPVGGLWVDRNGLLKGTFVNPLSEPLSNVVISYGRWAYRVEQTIGPGQSVRLDDLQRRDFEWLLTRRRIITTQTSYATMPWDIQSRDVPRILEIMLAYRAAGGKAYTGLYHRYQGHLDLSSHLYLGRALVVGQTAKPASHIYQAVQQGEDINWTQQCGQTWTWYRLIIPVGRWDRATGEVHPQ